MLNPGLTLHNRHTEDYYKGINKFYSMDNNNNNNFALKGLLETIQVYRAIIALFLHPYV